MTQDLHDTCALLEEHLEARHDADKHINGTLFLGISIFPQSCKLSSGAVVKHIPENAMVFVCYCAFLQYVV